MHEITNLLKAWNNGDSSALDKLMPLVEHELKKTARSYMRKEKPGNILQTTALVHEALMKLIRENVVGENRKQFYVIVAERMRQVLTDYARRGLAAKRGRRAEEVDVAEAEDESAEMSKEVLLLHAALTKLGTIDKRKVRIVECRYFIGLTLKEIADLLGTSQATVDRDWRFARAWLKRELTGDS